MSFSFHLISRTVIYYFFAFFTGSVIQYYHNLFSVFPAAKMFHGLFVSLQELSDVQIPYVCQDLTTHTLAQTPPIRTKKRRLLPRLEVLNNFFINYSTSQPQAFNLPLSPLLKCHEHLKRHLQFTAK